jgi:hypothetical protein
MFRFTGFSSVALALTALGAIAGASLSAEPANAVVYCKTVGVPKGCVVRPVAAAPAVVAVPVATPHVVYCKRRGVPKGCVVR